MDVGEGRELGAEALPAKPALQLNASGLAETLLHCSEVPWAASDQTSADNLVTPWLKYG
jgi:hypothetical protein